MQRDNIRLNKITSLILFVTNRCNLKCPMCFYWKNLNKDKDLTLEEFEKVAHSLPNLSSLQISGGEPFLREDLPKIIKLFQRNTQIKSIYIPTNGYFTDKIVEITKRILEELPSDIELHIGISLDGTEKIHDKIRGKNTFRRALETIKKLYHLKDIYPNIYITVLSVAMNYNYDSLLELIEKIKNGEILIDYYSLEILRNSKRDKTLNLPPIKKVKEIQKKVIDLNYLLLKNPKTLPYKNDYIAHLKRLYKEQQYFLTHKKLSINCVGGREIIVIEGNGTVKLCELLPPIGNIRNESLERILNNKKAKEQLGMIEEHRCDCTHCVYIGLSLAKYRKNDLFFKIHKLLSKVKL